ncbi:50S ribosomal protein L10 [Candidatus Wolfebacteria bacterium CG10_big_fil_rev_8_21_14_0_10_31_9]|uniref:Large ribosomal subunit protein uL10 n=1 Tax=Candidatus Wolfebacteria bacterium CG10_big_fil_rev_8_21_14_0_10_31_9 TaxID=1975070 RepID=A0A2H0RCW5_9BACT|nr:MAG: 50S ribosomal protein L10 [Candidatus Wolfebacteria bacterium CG10_big_fil_rev_8_21_14_0_10_31_9]
MKTKIQKQEVLKEAQKLIDENRGMVFVDFTGTSVEDIRVLRKTLKELGATMRVIKKKLLRVALEKKNVDFNPEQFEAQVATIFYDKEFSEVASPVFKFYKQKEKKGFNILGAYNLADKLFIDEAMSKMIGQLPSREILLGQFVGMLAAPIKMFLYVLDQKSKQN